MKIWQKRKLGQENKDITTMAVFNKEIILELVDGDLELLAEIVELFLDSSATQMGEIRKAVSENNAQALVASAHSLKGAIGNFGPSEAYEEAKNLEMLGRSGELQGAAEMLEKLEKQMEQFIPELKGLLATQ